MNARMAALPRHTTIFSVGTLAGATAIAVGLAASPVRTWSNLLVDGFYVLSLALGGMLFIAIQQLTGARWPSSVRGAAQAIAAALPIAAVMLLALFFGRTALYSWSAAPTAYLSTPLVFTRMVLFLGLWIAFERLLARGTAIHSAGFTIVFAISFSLATVDWLLSLNPHWSTTIFAVYQFAGVLVQGTAAITFIVVLLVEQQRLAMSDEDLHDLGKMLFAFTTFWAYLWFSQYLLIWYTNLPEETGFYLIRTGRAWRFWFLLNLVVNWVVPFVVLLAREPKRRLAVLKWIAVVIFIGRWLDVYLTVMPQTIRTPAFGVLEVAIAAGCASLVVAVVSSTLMRSVPQNHA